MIDPHDEVACECSRLCSNARSITTARRVTFEARRVVGLHAPDAHRRNEVGERHLHHCLLAERRQYLGDVPEVRPARADDQHFGARELPVVEEEECGSVQPDRGLARARTALHREHSGKRRADHLVLLHLDGRDDVEHLAGARPLELGEQRVAATEPDLTRLDRVVVEHVVGKRDQLMVLDHQLATANEAHRVAGTGAVERLRDRRAPLDHHFGARFGFDVAPSDVPAVAVVLVDPPEQQRARRVPQRGDAAAERDLVVELLEAARLHDAIEDALRARPHRDERVVRVVDVRLLGDELVSAHRCLRYPCEAAGRCARRARTTGGCARGTR